MFPYILGMIIDPKGYYLSFGHYTENFSDPCSLHGRSFLAALLYSDWVTTHKELAWTKGQILKIIQKSPFDLLNFDSLAFQYFERLSKLGYVVLLNGTYIGSDPLMIGYIPNHLSYPQIMTLLDLRSDILYCSNIESDFCIQGADYTTQSIYRWYYELEEKGMQRIRLNNIDEKF